jgi:hypothetical protein
MNEQDTMDLERFIERMRSGDIEASEVARVEQ